jgi:EF hand
LLVFPLAVFLQETVMRLRTLVAVAVAAAFAVPFSALAQSGKPAGAPAASAGGSAMDKDKDGSISRDEAKGTPLEKDFAKLDKNSDGKLSQGEVAAASSGAASGSTAPKK